MSPSNHLGNCQARIAEIEEHAPIHYDQDAFRASTFRETALAYASLADTENRERIAEQRQSKTVSHAIDILRGYPLEDWNSGEIMALTEILLDAIVSCEPAFGGDRVMSGISRDLRKYLDQAERREPVPFSGTSDDAEEQRCHDRAEARAINEGMRRVA